MNSKILLMNGPKGCGKDTATDYLINNLYPLVRREAKDKVHILTKEFFGVPDSEYWRIYNSRALKDLPSDNFLLSNGQLAKLKENISIDNFDVRGGERTGLWKISIREAMIYISECVCKPNFGRDYFGVQRANKIQENELCYDTSAGFTEELPPLIDKLGMDNILLIRIFGDKHSFGGDDSRGYIPEGVIRNTVDVVNNGSLSQYLGKVEEISEGFFYG